MGTSAVVGAPTESGGFRGRYVHYDGYPAGAGQALARIVSRDGLAAALRTLTQENACWVLLDADAAPDTGPRAWRPIVVAGYGAADPGDDDWFTDTSPRNAGCTWAYAATPAGVQVWSRRPGNPQWERHPELDLSYPWRETVWCEAHGGLANPHFDRPDCLHPHYTDPETRARLNAARIRGEAPQ